MDVRTARIQALRANIRRYSQLLATQLTVDEREFIHMRFAEGRLALEGLLAPHFLARQIGGTLEFTPGDGGGGTRLTVAFNP